MRRFRPAVDGLETRNLLTAASPWTVGPAAPPPTSSGARMTEAGGFAILQLPNIDNTTTATKVDASTVAVTVTDADGANTFDVPDSDVLEVIGGTARNDFDGSGADDTTVFVGGTGDNAAVGGAGFDFLCSTGSGSNDFTAGTYYTAFVAASSGTTAMHGGGAFSSASLCLGANTFEADARGNAVYCYGGSDAVDGTGDCDVYAVAPVSVNDPNARHHDGLF